MENDLEKIIECDIDSDGVFKYIQIKVTCNNSGESKLVVRGKIKYDYHAENFEDFVET